MAPSCTKNPTDPAPSLPLSLLPPLRAPRRAAPLCPSSTRPPTHQHAPLAWCRLEATYEIREDVVDVLKRVGAYLGDNDQVRAVCVHDLRAHVMRACLPGQPAGGNAGEGAKGAC